MEVRYESDSLELCNQNHDISFSLSCVLFILIFPVNVVGSDGALQYGELERTTRSLDKETIYRVMLGTDTTITEVDGSKILSTW